MRSNVIQNFILRVLKPFWLWIALQSVGGIVWAIDLSIRPYILKVVIDTLAMGYHDQALKQLLLPLSLYIGISLLVVVLFRLYDFAWIRMVAPMKAHIVDLVLKNIMLHNPDKTKSKLSGSITNIVNDVMDGIPEILKIVVDKFFTQFLAACIAIVTVATVGVHYASILIVWLLGFVVGSIYFTKRVKYICSSAQTQRGVLFANISDMLNNVTTIIMFATRSFESARLQQPLKNFIQADQARERSFMIISAFQGLTFISYQATCIVLLAIGFKHGIVSAGDFVFLLHINIALVGMLRNFSNELLSLSNIVSSVSHGLNKVLLDPEAMEPAKLDIMRGISGNIIFDNVNFSYDIRKPLFVNKSITIQSGQKIGLVGSSGGGKSTFINLIMKLYNINSGKITIDGYDLRNVSVDSLRYHISIIPQDTILFNRTIFENITYGTNANFDAVVVAATIARAHDFIMLLPDDYYYVVGDRGMGLSGGQRQRIAIARAILKNAPIVILDEPTSQLDTITESFLQESFLDLVAGKTTIVIAHRLSTLINMDRILVFEAGTIVEDGTHKQLLQRNGLYARLWSSQAQTCS